MSDFRGSVRRFMAAEVLPQLDQWERSGERPRELHKKAGAIRGGTTEILTGLAAKRLGFTA